MTTDMPIMQLHHRGLISVTGPDAADFLQNVMTADIRHAVQGKLIYALLLTPQGQILHDFFVSRQEERAENENAFYVDIDKRRMDDFLSRLKIFKLRAKVDISPVPAEEKTVYAAANSGLQDPRSPLLGGRNYSAPLSFPKPPGNDDDYLDLCTRAGIPDTSALRMQKDYAADLNLDQLGAIAWDKGCYIGQEVTARMHYKGLAKKRLMLINGKHIATGDMLFSGNNRVVGEVRQVSPRQPDMALAILRLDSLDSLKSAGGYAVTASKPEYLEIPAN